MTDYQLAIEGMKALLADTQGLIDSFKRGSYADAFQNYYMQILPSMEAIERLYGSVVDKDTMLSNMADSFVREVVKAEQDTPRRSRETVKINHSLAMAGYVYPAIRRYDGESSPVLIEHIQARWKEAFPKSNITPADFEDIEKGFHRKWCYITTAACRYRGMSDDCEELNLLRVYRDTWMMKQPYGPEMIHDYYDVAPSIVKHIGKRDDAALIYDDMWNRFIGPCIEYIREGRDQECLDTYCDMVREMEMKYFHLYPHIKSSGTD